MSPIHVLLSPEPKEAIEDVKTDVIPPKDKIMSNPSKLHQVLLAHMMKNSKQVEVKTEKE